MPAVSVVGRPACETPPRRFARNALAIDIQNYPADEGGSSGATCGGTTGRPLIISLGKLFHRRRRLLSRYGLVFARHVAYSARDRIFVGLTFRRGHCRTRFGLTDCRSSGRCRWVKCVWFFHYRRMHLQLAGRRRKSTTQGPARSLCQRPTHRDFIATDDPSAMGESTTGVPLLLSDHLSF